MKFKEKIIGVRYTTPMRLASLWEESTFLFIISTLGEVFGEIGCILRKIKIGLVMHP